MYSNRNRGNKWEEENIVAEQQCKQAGAAATDELTFCN